jgi:hypothetical protein
MSTCPDAINTSTVLIGLSDIRKRLVLINWLNKRGKFKSILAPGRPWSASCRRPSTPTDWRMFHDVNATEDWDGNNFNLVFLRMIFVLK